MKHDLPIIPPNPHARKYLPLYSSILGFGRALSRVDILNMLGLLYLVDLVSLKEALIAIKTPQSVKLNFVHPIADALFVQLNESGVIGKKEMYRYGYRGEERRE